MWQSNQETARLCKELYNLKPKDFCFKTYLSLNPDLQKNGVNDELSATEHYLLFGIKENRQYKTAETAALMLQQTSLNSTIDKWQAICNNTKIIFKKTNKPKITIIIPSYNKPYYTLACLESLYKADMIKDCEIIVVNDCSTDNTKKVLQEYVQGITLINNTSNLGFVQSCNIGANSSKAPYIIFLNNDTIVLKETVSALYHTIKNKNVGAAGGMIIMSNGLLQEAGSIVLSDGSCFGHGRNDDYTKPEYNYVKQVDFCSGALLITKKDLWSQIGGFDLEYSPGYYEEVDYCMKLKEMGYKIIYQPLSKIYHFEYSTFADKALDIQQQNRNIFVSKWHKSLESFPSRQQSIHITRSVNKNKRLLYVDDILPDPKKGQGYPRSYDILKYITSLGLQITLYATCPETVTDKNILSEFQQLGVEVVNKDLDFKSFILDRKNLYDIAFISRPHNAARYMNDIKENNKAKIIYDAEAIYANRELLQAEIIDGLELSEKVKDRHRLKELAITKPADTICLVSNYEKGFFDKNKVTNTKILGHYHPIRFGEKSFNERKDILFVGAIINEDKYNPNYDSIVYFINNVWPKTLDKLDCNLLLVGYNRSPAIKALDNTKNIKVIGGVEALDSYYNNCKLFIGPTRFAAGIPHKVTNAVSYGLPSVITPLLAKQLEWSNGKECLIGKDDQDFAEKIAMLYTDKNIWTNIRNNMKQYTENKFNKKIFNNCLNEMLL